MDEIQHALAGSRLRFGASLAAFLVVFFIWLYVSANWNSDIQIAGLFVHDLLLVALLALRFRQLRLHEAWALLAFVPLVGLLVAVFLFVRNSPAPERYSAL
jgi:hypothetical protein